MIETTKAEQLHPFNFHAPQYDQSTYKGRLATLFSTQNPFNFFLPHSKILEAKALVDEESRLAKEKESSVVYYSQPKIDEIRRAQNIVDSAIHPDTKEFIPRPMRICSYASISIPTLFGMILSRPTTFNIIFWQWANQSYSAVLNYGNRNASSSLDNKGLMVAYGAAVTSSIGIGLTMRKLLTPISRNLKGPAQLFVNSCISLAAVGSAGFLNLLIMRSNEIKEGITLVDSEGLDRGRSKIIAKKAVVSTAFTRFLMPIPPIMLPTICFYVLQKKSLIPKNKMAKF
jgi:F0F1-type ATP synthase membrane subunit c/vacuolar-type H+-ATPase subunit K